LHEHEPEGDDRVIAEMSPLGSLGDLGWSPSYIRYSNRPFGVKHFQTIRRCSIDVAHGLAILFGIGTRALPSWDSRTRRNNLSGGLAVRRTVGPSGHANSPRPSSREGHHSTARWSSCGWQAMAHRRPPWAPTIERRIASPIPMPLGFVV
jgi:hypothetical protein